MEKLTKREIGISLVNILLILILTYVFNPIYKINDVYYSKGSLFIIAIIINIAVLVIYKYILK